MIELVDCAEEHRWLLLEWRNSDQVAQHMHDSEQIPTTVHDAWYARLLARDGRRGWVVTMGDEPVGAAFISDHHPKQRRAAFGLYLAVQSTRGKGVGSAAQYLLCEHAFSAMGLHKLCCEALSFNEAAIALYRKVGFEQEGVLRDHLLREGRWVHVHQMAMFEDRWAVQRELLAPELRELGLIS